MLEGGKKRKGGKKEGGKKGRKEKGKGGRNRHRRHASVTLNGGSWAWVVRLRGE